MVHDGACTCNGILTLIHTPYTAPTQLGSQTDNRDRNIGIGVGVGVGGFLLIVVVVIIIAVLILALRKRNTEKYVLNYSTVYGECNISFLYFNNYIV